MKVSISKSLTDYSLVRRIVGRIVQNKKLFLRQSKIEKKYLDVGCAGNIHDNFVNLDYTWTPQIDVCWDITRPLPFEDHSFEGIFTEHCLEHITLAECKNALKEFFRITKNNAIVRIVVPDGELYFDIYNRKKKGENIYMPYEEGYITPMARVNGIFRNHGHQFIYDFATLKLLLEMAGFRNIIRRSFKEGSNKDLLIDSKERELESLYVEAQK
ncbi:MAG TPA: methyltransferase domain-containing protein [Chitinophagaceae bacterium]|nr:methyltransferase domain-containing protein [Chitinophagaceae bacterium]